MLGMTYRHRIYVKTNMSVPSHRSFMNVAIWDIDVIVVSNMLTNLS